MMILYFTISPPSVIAYSSISNFGRLSTGFKIPSHSASYRGARHGFIEGLAIVERLLAARSARGISSTAFSLYLFRHGFLDSGASI